MMIKSIPLASLVVSPRNVRKASDPAADAQLASDIAARGLLQNLVVTPQKKPKASYAVEAGGRRLRALLSLQDEGALPKDHTVACLVIGERAHPAAATEASLAENLQRLAMNPADECLAFSKLIAEGADVEGVARRFGLTVRHVDGRLRLAGLHPTVFEALGAGEITLDAAKAYAATSDQERQLWVFEQLHHGWSGAHPDSIRRMMTSATVPVGDRRMKFVGEGAYLAAGGRIERDLFAEGGDARALDIAILEQLATDKLEVEAAWLANEHGYAFVRATLDAYVQSWQHEDIRRAAIELPELGDDEQGQVARIEAEIDRLTDVLEDEDTEDRPREAAEARIAELEVQLRDLASRPPALDAEIRASVGFFLLLDEAGTPRLDRTPYALVADGPVDAPADGAGGVDTAGELGAGDGESSRSSRVSGDAAAKAGAAPPRVQLSQRLIDELAMQRRDILAYHLAADPELAFDLAVFLMVKDEGGYCHERSGSSLSARPPGDPVLRSALPEAPVNRLLAQADDALDRSWTSPDTLAARFDGFRALPREARDAWLGAALARTLEASTGDRGRPCVFHDHLGTLIGVDVPTHWRPTALNWFDRVPKAVCLAALTEVGGSELAARHAKAKKAEIAELCEKVFAGEPIVEAEIKAAALAWVPEPMRFVPPHAADDAPPWSDDEAQAESPAAPAIEQAEPIVIGAGPAAADGLGAGGGDGLYHRAGDQDQRGLDHAEPSPGAAPDGNGRCGEPAAEVDQAA